MKSKRLLNNRPGQLIGTEDLVLGLFDDPSLTTFVA
jgi:hypothetical protein